VNTMVIFTEAFTRKEEGKSLQTLRRITASAEMLGLPVISVPYDFDEVSASDALAAVDRYENEQPAIWIGFIPSPHRYQELYAAAMAKNIRLVNDLEAHLHAQEFHLYYPFITRYTPQSAVIQRVEEAETAAASLGFPLFVRGAIQSRKYKGLSACLATNLAELQGLVTQLLDAEDRSRGRVILRRFLSLRHVELYQNFPQGREYRVFVLDGKVVEMGYYWDQPDSLAELNLAEQLEVRKLAETAAQLVPSRFIAVDIGQAESGKWWVIEMGDAQFSGLGQVSPLKLLTALNELLPAG
jgi:hypothetical protein